MNGAQAALESRGGGVLASEDASALSRWRPAVFALSAVAVGCCYWPRGSGWLMWAGLVPLLWSVEGERPGRALLAGWLWGTLAWGVAMRWFFRVALVFAAGPRPWRLLLALGVIAYHGLQAGLAAGSARWAAAGLERRGFDRRLALGLCAAPFLVAAEGLYPQVYPACVAVTQWGHLPAMQSLDLWGPGGLSWLILGVNAALYLAWRAPTAQARRAAAAAAAGVFLLNEAYGLVRARQVDAEAAGALAAGRSMRVTVLQGDLPLSARNTGASAGPNIGFYDRLTARALADGPSDLVVWPHNSYERTLSFDAGDAGLERPTLGGQPLGPRLAADLPFATHVLVTSGARSPLTTDDPTPSHHYVAVLKGPDGSVLGTTAKVNPTPLAEFMPFGRWLPFLYRLAPTLKRVVPGPSRPLVTRGGRRLGVYVCYDGVKTSVARRLAAAGAQVLINPSSDQWSYDKTAQPWQHLRIVRMRAVEDRRAYVRATPSGLSVVVDPVGRVVRELPLDAEGSFTETVPLLDGRTVFMALGDAPYWLALLLSLILLALSTTTRRPGR